MTSPSPPVIDFRKNVSTTSSATDGQVVLALENYGCFMAKYENLKGCRQELEKKLPEFFKASKENPQYESFDIPEATNEGIDKFTTTIWPKGNNDKRNAIGGYTTTAAQLEAKVREIVFEHYKIPKKSTGYIFRRMKYKEEVRLGCSDHTNRMEFLAMKYNGQWFKIDVKPSTFLIMAGKPLEDWSEGKIRHQEHGVKMHGNKEKYSVGLFSYCKEQVGSSSRS